MLPTIVVSTSLENRTEKIIEILDANQLNLNHPDLFFLDDEEKLGVAAVKKIKDFLSLKPYSAKGRGIVIISSHKLTHDAQNSLLKILEEPPASAVILLGAETDQAFLPTILSRCQVVSLEFKVQSSELEKYYPDIERLINASIDERFTFIEKLEDKDAFLKSLVSYFQLIILRDREKSHNLKVLDFSNKLIDAEKYLSAKGNQRAILEYLILNLPGI